MDVREKLVELQKESVKNCDPGTSCLTCTYRTQADCMERITADFMIAHGVTVQECGHWVYDFNLAGSNFYRCSVCDRQETLLEKEDIYEYCPFCHCGAKMMPQPPKGE